MSNTYTYFERTANVNPNAAADINQLSANIAALYSTNSTAAPGAGETISEIKAQVDAITGGGSGISIIETKSAFKQIGKYQAISDRQHISQAFAGGYNISASLNTAYTYGDTAIEVLNLSGDGLQPVLPLTLTIWATGAGDLIQHITLSSLNSTTSTASRYEIQDTLSTAYAVANTRVANRTMDLTNLVGQFNTTDTISSGAFTAYDSKKILMSTSPAVKNLQWSHRWYDDSFVVSSFPSSTAITFTVNTASDVNKYVNADKIWLFQRVWNGVNYDSPYDATLLKNAKRLTLDQAPTYNATAISVTVRHTEANTHSLTSGWAVVRESAAFGYRADSTLTGAIIYPTPDDLVMVANESILRFADTFNRAIGAIGNNWVETTPTVDIAVAGEMRVAASAAGLATGSRTLEGYTLSKLPLEIYLELQLHPTSQFRTYIVLGGTGNETAGGGFGIYYDGSSWDFNENNVTVASYAYASPSINEYVNLKLQFHRNKMKLKVWNISSGEVEPTIWQEYDNGGDFAITSNEGTLYVGSYSASGNHETDVLFFKATPVNSGYLTVGTEASISATKLETWTKLTRNSATISFPEVYERNAVIVD